MNLRRLILSVVLVASVLFCIAAFEDSIGLRVTTGGVLQSPTNFFTANASNNWHAITNAGYGAAGSGLGYSAQLGSQNLTNWSALPTNLLQSLDASFITSGVISSANLSSNVVEIPDASWNARPAGDAVFPIWNDTDQEFQFTTNFMAGGITGVLPSGTVAINSMVAGSVLGNNGTSRLWTNCVGPLTVVTNPASPTTALIVNGNQTVTGEIAANALKFASGQSIKVDTATLLGATVAFYIWPTVTVTSGYGFSSSSSASSGDTFIRRPERGWLQIITNSFNGTFDCSWPSIGVVSSNNATLGIRSNVVVSGSVAASTLSGYFVVATNAPPSGFTHGLIVTNSYGEAFQIGGNKL